MRTLRKLRAVPNCPQPEGKPIRELITGDGKHLVFGHEGYGCKPVERLPHSPTAQEITIRARAQSLLSKGGKRAELPSYEEALEIIAKSEH